MDRLLTRFADIRIAAPTEVEYYDNVFGPRSLPIEVRHAAAAPAPSA